VGDNDTDGEYVDVGAGLGTKDVGTTVGTNEGEEDGAKLGVQLGFLLERVGVVDGCVVGWIVGCPVGLAHRGNTFIQAFLHCVGNVFANAAAPTNPGFDTELNVKELWAFEIIENDAPDAGEGP